MLAPEDQDEIDALRVHAVAGDTRAMETLLSRLQPVVMSRCSRLLPCRADAEEAAQDALVSIAKGLGTYSGRGSFAGWVSVVAANSARSTYRSLRRRSVEQTMELSPEARNPRTTSVIAGSRLDLLDALDALQATKPHLVEAFVLRDLSGLPYDEVAARTGVPIGTAKARIHHARAFVRERLSEHPA